MLKKYIPIALAVISLVTTCTSCSKVDNSYVELRYAVTNDMTKNLVVMIHSNSWNEGLLRLKFIPKSETVNIEKMIIQFEDQPLTTFADLKGSLNLTDKKEKIIQLNEAFPAGKLDLNKLSIATLQGALQ